MTTKLEALRSDEAALRKELEAAGSHFRGRVCRCPFHDDKSPSAGIFYKDGVWKFKCHGCGFGGDVLDVRARRKETKVEDEIRSLDEMRPVQPTSQVPATKVYPTFDALVGCLPHVEDCYADLYAPVEGEGTFAVIRWHNSAGKKAFTQCSRTAGGWWMKAPTGLLPIANRKGIAVSQKVVVVEGEKALRALASIGICATTSPGGALNGNKADWSPLAGKMVTLWPDADPADDEFPRGKGWEHMQRVAKELMQLTPTPEIYLFDPSEMELPAKGDAHDAVERYRKTFSEKETKAVIENLLADGKRLGVLASYIEEIKAQIAGKRRPIPFVFPDLNIAARALQPGEVLCVCGDGGSGKSMFITQNMLAWIEFEYCKPAIYIFEDTQNYHLQRLQSQIGRDSRLNDRMWVENHGPEMLAAVQQHGALLEKVGQAITEAPLDGQVTMEMLLAWMESKAKAGYDLLIVDPVTALSGNARPWIQDLELITKMKLLGRRFGCRFILITHPRTGAKSGKSNHNDMAGGAAFPRFSHTVLWLERNEAETEYRVRGSEGPQFIKPNRVLYIAKARNGPGASRRIAFNFNPTTLCYEEIGMIERE
jgi:hypothetical protein